MSWKTRSKYFDSFKEEIKPEEAYELKGLIQSIGSRLEDVEMSSDELILVCQLLYDFNIACMRRLRGDG